MRKSLFWMMVFAVAFLFAVTTLQAQTKEDLGALAKKEKARREALEKQKEQQKKEKKVYTNDDIPKIKSQLGIMGSGDTGSDQATTTEQQPDENQAAANTVDYDKQIQELNDQKDALQTEVDKARDVTNGGAKVMSSNYADLVKSINDNEKKMEQLDAKIQDLQRQKEQAAQQQQQPQQQPSPPETPEQQQQL